MKNQIVRSLAIGTVALFATLTSTGTSGPPAEEPEANVEIPEDAVPAPLPDNTDEDVVYVDERGDVIQDPAETASEAADSVQVNFVCKPVTKADQPHVSTKSKGRAVQGKGHWSKGTCTRGTAKVTACLYQYYSNHRGGAYWQRKGCQTRTLVSSGTNKAIAHVSCHSAARTGWQTVVDVDVVGQADTKDVKRNTRDIACRTR